MAEDEAKVLADAKRLSLADRVEHKNWKVRSEAYEDLKARCDRAFSDSDPIFEEAGPLLAKIVGDSNANCMDKGLEALCGWLSKVNEAQAARVVSSVCSSIASKCLKARPATVTKATDACMSFIELEQSTVVVEALLKSLNDKVPKVVLAALEVLFQAVSDFGIPTVDPKPLFKSLPCVFGHSNASIRDKAKEISVALAAYTGLGVIQSTLLEKMSDTMRKEVETSIAALPGKKAPTRFTRKEAAAHAAAGPRGEADADGLRFGASNDAVAMDVGDDALNQDLDAYEYTEPVDILGPLGKAVIVVGDESSPFWECFDSKKWNIRKGALDRARDAAKKPRLATGDYGDLCRELRKVLSKDANINCAARAAEVVGGLACGLRLEFAGQGRQLVGPLLERFKEKNQIMSKAADEALRTMAQYCFGIGDVTDDLVAALGHKNPKVRLDTLRLVREMVTNSDRKQLARAKDALASAVTKQAPDGDATVREAAQTALVAIALKMGSFSAIESHVSKLDDSRAKLIQEAVSSAAKDGGQPSQKSSATAGPSRTVSTASSVSARSSPKALAPKNPNITVVRPTAAASKPPTARTKASTAPKPSSLSAVDDAAAVTSGRLTAEEADGHLTELVGADSVQALRSPQWQERVEAMTAVCDATAARLGNGDLSAAAVVLCLEHLPGWSEKNFQVLNKAFELMTTVARSSPQALGRVHGALIVEGAGDKIHELKHRLQAAEALTAAAEAVGPRFICAQLHGRAANNKNPKVLSESLAWMVTAVDEFGLSSLDLGALLKWMIADLGSPNAPVRNQAMAVLGRCHVQVGPGLMAQLQDALKPAQVTTLEEIFRKNPQDTAYTPSRKVARASSLAKARGTVPGDGGEDGNGKGDNAVLASGDDLLPRADISDVLHPALIQQIGSANWKERNAALDEIENALRLAGGRILPDLPADLWPALRGRMGDTNRNLAAKTLLLIGKLSDAVGPPFDRIARPVLVPALGALTDNKKQVRDAVISMLDSWIKTCTADKLIPAVCDVAVNVKVSADGRAAALAWMTRCFLDRSNGFTKCTESAFRTGAAALCDKAGTVRDGGSQLITEVARAVGSNGVAVALAGLDAAMRKAVEPVLQKTTIAANGDSMAETVDGRPVTAAARPTSSKTTTRSAAAALGEKAAVPSANAVSVTLPGDQDEPPILSMSSAKLARSKAFRLRPGGFDVPSLEEVEGIEAGLAGVASPTFSALLFSLDFRDHVRAADALEAALPSFIHEIAASLDLLLRWTILRICDGNMQVLVRVLEVLRGMMHALTDAHYTLTDAEAAALLPGLVEKSGHNQDRVRALHRDVLRACCGVYPPHKVIDYLATGLTSKNVRTRTESTKEVIGAVVAKEGVPVLVTSRAKPLPTIAALLKERDATLRAAALNVLELVYTSEGSSSFWKLVGKLDLKEKEALEDRLRRVFTRNSNLPPAAERLIDDNIVTGAPPVPGMPRRYSNDQEDAGLAYSRPTAFTPPTALDMTPVTARPRSAAVETPIPGAPEFSPHRDAQTSYATMNNPPRVVGIEAAVDAFVARWEGCLLKMETAAILEERINATKMLCGELMSVVDPKVGEANSPDDGTWALHRKARAVMGASAERLFSTVLEQLGFIFDKAELEAAANELVSPRGCKFALNVMLQGLSVDEIAKGVPQGTLRAAISLLLVHLSSSQGLLIFQDGPTLVRAVNVLIAKMLDAANCNYSFAALMQLMREPPPSLPEENASKFIDLVVKCLIKLTKGLSTNSGEVDMAVLLLNIHDFFMFLGVEEIRRRSSVDDKPLRMVKTLLNEVCRLLGHGVYEAASGIPGRNRKPQPIIFAYIALNLSQLEQNGAIQPANNGTEHTVPAAVVEPAVLTQEVEAQAVKADVKRRLKDIMSGLVQRDPAAQEVAMVDLYRLKKEQPEYVERYIAGTSEMFRHFIDEGLANLEDRVRRGIMVTTPLSSHPLHDSSGSGQSDGSQTRLSSLKERLSSLRHDGGKDVTRLSPAKATGLIPAVEASILPERRKTDPAARVNEGSTEGTRPPTVQELAARLQLLRQNQQ